jgi:glycine cleavage system H protein
MKALRHPFNEFLALTGVVGLLLLALPVIAILIFVLRAAMLVAIPGGLAVGAIAWVTSARFRAWLGTGTEPEVTYKGLRLATDVAVHPGHAWVRMDGADAVVGSDDLLPAILGPVQSVELPPTGRLVARGDVLFRLVRGDRAVDVRAPVSGTVTACNEALARDPELVNADPFRRGWAVTMRGAPELKDGRGLRRGREAGVWFRAEVDRLLAAVQGDVASVPAMADGGVVAADLYQRIDAGTWRRVTENLGGRS